MLLPFLPSFFAFAIGSLIAIAASWGLSCIWVPPLVVDVTKKGLELEFRDKDTASEFIVLNRRAGWMYGMEVTAYEYTRRLLREDQINKIDSEESS